MDETYPEFRILPDPELREGLLASGRLSGFDHLSVVQCFNPSGSARGLPPKPITMHQIKAAEVLLPDPEFRDHIEPETLTDTVAGKAMVLDDEAKLFAATHRVV